MEEIHVAILEWKKSSKKKSFRCLFSGALLKFNNFLSEIKAKNKQKKVKLGSNCEAKKVFQ